MERLCLETDRHPLLLPIPFGVASLIGLGGDLVTCSPSRSPRRSPPTKCAAARRQRRGGGRPDLADLSIPATALEPILPTYLYRYRKGGQYADQLTAAAKA